MGCGGRSRARRRVPLQEVFPGLKGGELVACRLHGRRFLDHAKCRTKISANRTHPIKAVAWQAIGRNCDGVAQIEHLLSHELLGCTWICRGGRSHEICARPVSFRAGVAFVGRISGTLAGFHELCPLHGRSHPFPADGFQVVSEPAWTCYEIAFPCLGDAAPGAGCRRSGAGPRFRLTSEFGRTTD